MASRGTFPRPRGHRHARLFAVLGLLSLGTAWSFASFARASSVGARATEGTTSSSTTTLKDDLLKRCEDFKQKQTEMWDLMDDEAETEKVKKSKKKDKASLLEAESFAAQRVQLSDELQELRAKCVEVIEELAEKNPTAQPTIGWRGYAGEPPKNSPLNGTWELLFTDAADATFKKGKRGSAKTFQEIDAELGWFINCVDFSNEKSNRDDTMAVVHLLHKLSSVASNVKTKNLEVGSAS
ncbi:unnamed protein product [Durusdinium trenchii]|uniref:Plastid lipid-associated protein/fibrillin conserved domain-containing protein n=1 Tax=Durusdinium trenchii TaxID=1381693 RepID=A0ABP0Q6J0_9DINO